MTDPTQSNERGVLRHPSFPFPDAFDRRGATADRFAEIVYDLDRYGDDPEATEAIDRVLASEQFIAFSPQTLAEARNRGYRPHRSVSSADAGTS
jgi:hypothetical protein